MRKTRVMIVEDTAATRELLRFVVHRDEALEVAACASSAEEALRLLPEVRPDIVSMDIHLPGMSGLDAIRKIMSAQPTPTIVVSTSVREDAVRTSMDALAAGALAVVETPTGPHDPRHAELSARLCRQLAIMSTVRVVRQRRFDERSGAAATATGSAVPAGAGRRAPSSRALVGIVASTGGPSALQQVLQGLGEGFPLPVLVVQHIDGVFLEGFVRWLGELSPLPVAIAADGETPAPGRVYVAPSDRHLRLAGRALRYDSAPPVNFHRPSGTVLLESLATELGADAIGVVLTGMGSDGAEGLREIRLRGGHTIAEDESTAVVFGMPAAATQLGAVEELLPLGEIGPRVAALVAEGCAERGGGRR